MTGTQRTAAVVGATGGAGTTRLTLELAAVLARGGRSVAVFDVAFGTQGLAEYVRGRIEPDAARVLADDASLDAAMLELPVDAPGTVSVCPANASFVTLSRAKTPEAARRLEALLDPSTARYDHVLVDVPPLATNPAVAAVTAADRVVAVTPATVRGREALQRLNGRLDDVGAAPSIVVANRASDSHPIAAADVRVPENDVTAPDPVPVAAREDGPFTAAIADVATTTFGARIDVTADDGRSIL